LAAGGATLFASGTSVFFRKEESYKLVARKQRKKKKESSVCDAPEAMRRRFPRCALAMAPLVAALVAA
jgi:hypothetical protein